MTADRRVKPGAVPPRSCSSADGTPGEGGEWRLARSMATGSRPWWASDYHQVVAAFEGPARTHIISTLKARMKRAERGMLMMEGEFPEAAYLQGGTELMEIRIEGQYGVDDAGDTARLHVRLYYHEPAAVARALDLLYAAAKHDHPPGVDEQNQHIGTALSRLDGCIFTP